MSQKHWGYRVVFSTEMDGAQAQPDWRNFQARARSFQRPRLTQTAARKKQVEFRLQFCRAGVTALRLRARRRVIASLDSSNASPSANRATRRGSCRKSTALKEKVCVKIGASDGIRNLAEFSVVCVAPA